jgi:hypothetical protein
VSADPQNPPAEGIAGAPDPAPKTPYRAVLMASSEEGPFTLLGKYEGDDVIAKRAALADPKHGEIVKAIDNGAPVFLAAPPVSSWRPKQVQPPNPRYRV